MSLQLRHASKYLLLVLVLVIGLWAVQDGDADPGPSDLLLTDLSMKASLGIDCETNLELRANVTNIGASSITAIEIRVDVRGLIVQNSTVDGVGSATTVTPIENYVLLIVSPADPVMPMESVQLHVKMTTLCLQERIGLNEQGTAYLMQLIYYFRPMSEVRGFTFTALLPQHAVLQADSTNPLFPRPTANLTDGLSMAFVWSIASLLPGQESAFIVKYEMPVALMEPPAAQGVNTGLLVAVAAIIGAAAVLSIERLPGIVKQMRMTTAISDASLSEHEGEILALIATKGGSCPQREIYENLDMSQSMASMILSSLEQRGIIKRLKSGRENIVHIMEE